jgi:hypothetical protein
MFTYLVELGPCRRLDPARAAVAAKVAAKVARTFGPRPTSRLATPSSLEALARRRLGLVRFTRPE